MLGEPNKELLLLNAIIAKETLNIKSGSPATKLASAIKQYEFSTARTLPLTNDLLMPYYSSLLISHNFIELECAVYRNYKIYPQAESKLYLQLVEAVRLQKLEEALNKAKSLSSLPQPNPLKQLYTDAIKSHILKFLAKHYINFQLEYLTKNYEITKEDLTKLGYQLDEKYVVLPEQQQIQGVNDLLIARIKQVSQITESIAKVQAK